MREVERGVLSFPKCGRTWIRLFLVYYQRLTSMKLKPWVIFRHDNDEFDFRRRVLLIRHPCDVMVSFCIHRRVRSSKTVNISEFIRSKDSGVPLFNERYTRWSKRKDNQLVICYEDLFGAQPWVDMLEFWGIPFHEEAFNGAIGSTRFDTIRSNLEEIKTFPSAWRYLAAERGNFYLVAPDDPEAHKFRRGKVGGYVDYLETSDIEYILSTFTLGENLEPYRQQYLEGHYA